MGWLVLPKLSQVPCCIFTSVAMGRLSKQKPHLASVSRSGRPPKLPKLTPEEPDDVHPTLEAESSLRVDESDEFDVSSNSDNDDAVYNVELEDEEVFYSMLFYSSLISVTSC